MLVHVQGVDATRVPARGVGGLSRRRKRADSCRDGHWQDARGVVGAAARSGRREEAERQPAIPCAVADAASGARGGYARGAGTAGGRPRPAVDHRDQDGRHLIGSAGATGAAAAECADHHAGELLAAADAGGCPGTVRFSSRGDRGRVARADGKQAGRAGATGAGAGAGPAAERADVGVVGDDRQPGDGARRAAGRRSPGAHRAGRGPEAGHHRLADSPADRALPLGGASRHPDGAAGRRRRSRRDGARWCSPTRDRRRRSGTGRSSRRGRTGPGS